MKIGFPMGQRFLFPKRFGMVKGERIFMLPFLASLARWLLLKLEMTPRVIPSMLMEDIKQGALMKISGTPLKKESPQNLESLSAEELISLVKKQARDLQEKEEMILFLRRELTELDSQMRAYINHFAMKKKFDC